MHRLLRNRGAQILALTFFVYSLCPPFTSFDSYYTVPTALSLILHGDTRVDEYVVSAPPVSHSALDCVPPRGTAVSYPDARGCPGGHWYNFFPVGVPLLAVPPIFAMRVATGVFAAAFPGAAMAVAQPVVASFLRGDLVGGHALAELGSAAAFGAISVWLMYRTLLLFAPAGQALFLSFLFAFGTAEWSIASRNLFQHGPSAMCLLAALYLLASARAKPHLVAYASIPLSFAFAVRPSNFIPIAVFTLFVAVHYRAFLLRFLAWAMPVAALFFLYNLRVLHGLIPRYYHPDAPGVYPILPGFAADLISPSRGLLVFTPVFFFAIVGMALAIRNRWCWPLPPYLIAIVCLHAILISRYRSGHSYGQRYYADITPLFVFFLVPALQLWLERRGARRLVWAAVFLAFALWGVFVHARGATSVAVQEWNLYPVDVTQAPWRVWEWRDPQFLRGLRQSRLGAVSLEDAPIP